MKILKAGVIAILFVCTLLACTSRTAVPTEQTQLHWVMDQADLLSTVQEDSIAAISRNLEAEVGSQIAVLTIQSLDGEKIEDYSLRRANEMKIGRATHNDGVLITVSANDHQMRIEVGKGLEKVIKDDIAARIIREDMAPKFRENKYAEGLYTALEKLASLIRENQQLVGK
jgi:uncharacterized protein